MNVETDDRHDAVVDYVRSRADGDPPIGLVHSVLAELPESTGSRPRTRTLLHIAAAIGSVVLASILVVVIVFMASRSHGTGGNLGTAPFASLASTPVLRGQANYKDDSLQSVTYFLGFGDGRVLASETVAADRALTDRWVGPFGSTFIKLAEVGNESEVSIATTEQPAPQVVYRDPERIKAATLTPDGKDLFIYRQDRKSNVDLGVWRVDMIRGEALQVVAASDAQTADESIASVFTWTPDGHELVVQACKADLGDDCSWTVLDRISGDVREVVPPEQTGRIIGIANAWLLTGRNCDGIDCVASLVDLRSGATTDVDVAAAREALIESPSGPLILYGQQRAGERYEVTARRPDSAKTTTVFATDDSSRVLVNLERGAGGIELPPGWFALAQEGQLAVQHAESPVLINASTGETRTITQFGD